MAGVNRVILVGHLGKDPEVKTFESGDKVANFSLATTETYKNKEGQKIDSTEWHNIVVWRGLADIAEKYLKKGQLVFIEGKIKTKKYEKDGQTRYITEINADSMTMLGGKTDSVSAPIEPSSQPETPIVPEPSDDLPF